MIFVQISSLIKAIPKIIVPKATNCMSSESNVQTCLSITESRWQKAKANLSAFLLGFSFMIICLVCCSCGSTKVVPIETIRDHQVHDTLYINNVQYDSIYVSQDKFIDRSKDTILIRQHDVEYKYKLLRDTIEHIKLEVRHDSIPYKVRIIETQQVKYIPPWTKALAYIGIITILILLIYTFTKLKHF